MIIAVVNFYGSLNCVEKNVLPKIIKISAKKELLKPILSWHIR